MEIEGILFSQSCSLYGVVSLKSAWESSYLKLTTITDPEEHAHALVDHSSDDDIDEKESLTVVYVGRS